MLMLFVHALWYYEGQVSAPHPSLVPGFMPDENAIGPGQSTYQIAGNKRQTVYVINIGISGLYERNFKTFLCAREVIISKTKMQLLFYSFDQFIKYFGVYLVVDEK